MYFKKYIVYTLYGEEQTDAEFNRPITVHLESYQFLKKKTSKKWPAIIFSLSN